MNEQNALLMKQIATLTAQNALLIEQNAQLREALADSKRDHKMEAYAQVLVDEYLRAADVRARLEQGLNALRATG